MPVRLSPRQQLLLTYLALPAPGGTKGFTDPIRIMKGLFVFGQEVPASWIGPNSTYEFVAYNYGPCSFGIYDDLAVLERSGFVVALDSPGRDWKQYGVTPSGGELVDQVRGQWDPRVVEYLSRLKSAFSRMSFASLLRTVYSKYPDYAKNSLLRS